MDSREHGDRNRKRQTVGRLDHDMGLKGPPVRRLVASLQADRDAAEHELREQDDRSQQHLRRDELGGRHRRIAPLRAEPQEVRARAEGERRDRELEQNLVRSRSVDETRERGREGDRGNERTRGNQVESGKEERERGTVHVATPARVRHDERTDLEGGGGQAEKAGQEPRLDAALERVDRPHGDHHREQGQRESKEQRGEVTSIHASPSESFLLRNQSASWIACFRTYLIVITRVMGERTNPKSRR